MNGVKNINGKTDIYGVIGYPIGHSFSPIIHNTLAELLNHNLVYVPFEVKTESLESAISGAYALGIKGLNVTIPHKREIIKYLYAIDDLAEKIGAVNTLKYTDKGYKGYNTDMYGLKACLDNRKVVLENKNVVLLGAGGAAMSATFMCVSNNVKKLHIINRTLNNAYSIAQNLKKHYNVDIDVLSYSELNRLDSIDICIQTTSIGMSPDLDSTPIEDKDFYKKINIAVDIIFNPWQTRFLKEAQAAKCQIINGFDMLYFQAVKSYEIWHDIIIPCDIKIQAKDMLEFYYTNN